MSKILEGAEQGNGGRGVDYEDVEGAWASRKGTRAGDGWEVCELSW